MSARAAAVKICEAQGKCTVNQNTAIECFKQFNNGEISLEDRARLGHPASTNIGAVMSAELSGEQLDYAYAALSARRYPALVSRKHAPLRHDYAPAHTAALIKTEINEPPQLIFFLIQHIVQILRYPTIAFSLVP